MENKASILTDNIVEFVKGFVESDTALEKSLVYSINLLSRNDIDKVLFVYSLCDEYKVSEPLLIATIYALNLVSFYIHYDLPSMLNKSYRNTMPCIHTLYDESVAHLCLISINSIIMDIISKTYTSSTEFKNSIDNGYDDFLKKYNDKLSYFYSNLSIINSIDKSNIINKKDILSEMQSKRQLWNEAIIEGIFEYSKLQIGEERTKYFVNMLNKF